VWLCSTIEQRCTLSPCQWLTPSQGRYATFVKGAKVLTRNLYAHARDHMDAQSQTQFAQSSAICKAASLCDALLISACLPIFS